MSVYWDKVKGRWRYSYNRIVGGQRSRITKLLPQGWSKRRAEAFDREKSGSLYAQAAGFESERVDIAGAVNLYIVHRCPELRNGKKATMELAHLNKFTQGKFLDQADEVAAAYSLEMKGALAPATIRNRLAYLRAAIRYARKKHLYGRGQPDYTASMDIPTPDNERQTYAKLAELENLWNSFTYPEAAALFKLAFYSGLRWRNELLPRVPADIVKDEDGDLWLKLGDLTKNGEPVMKPVPPKAHDALQYLPFEMSDSWFYARWHEAVAKIGRPDLKPHDLRHSLGSDVISRPGGTLADVAAALHHKSPVSSKRYAHLYPERMKAILSATGSVRENAHRRVKSTLPKPAKAA